MQIVLRPLVKGIGRRRALLGYDRVNPSTVEIFFRSEVPTIMRQMFGDVRIEFFYPMQPTVQGGPIYRRTVRAKVYQQQTFKGVTSDVRQLAEVYQSWR